MTEATDNQQNAPAFNMRAHYIKDLSFENPKAPHSLFSPSDSQPKIDFNVNLAADRLNENSFELAMEFNVRASAEKTLFIAELTYAGVFEVANVAEEHLEQLILVDCAFLLFPFARRVVADVTRDGGFPPLLLEPLDFYGMFTQNKQQAS